MAIPQGLEVNLINLTGVYFPQEFVDFVMTQRTNKVHTVIHPKCENAKSLQFVLDAGDLPISTQETYARILMLIYNEITSVYRDDLNIPILNRNHPLFPMFRDWFIKVLGPKQPLALVDIVQIDGTEKACFSDHFTFYTGDA